jgi:hypothetical protein
VTRTMAKTAVANTHTMESESLHGEHSPRSPGCDHASAQYEHLVHHGQSSKSNMDGPSVSTYGHANIGRDRTHNGPVDPVSGAHGASGSPVQVPFSKHG